MRKRTLTNEEVMQGILTHDRMVQPSRVRRERRISKHEGKNNNKGRSKFRAKDGCFECGSKDHWKKNCPAWSEKRNKGKKPDEAGLQKVMVSFYLLIALIILMHLLSLPGFHLLIGFWIPSAHIICSNKSWFDTYEVDCGGEVVMGDGSVCRVEGTITIKEMGMVSYIPKLKKNLISLSSFDKNGYSYKVMGGKLIISKGSRVVMKGEIQHNCLYPLCGTTVTGGAAIFTKKDSENEAQF
ncbi:hypothetical protein Prudu_021531 [Prunus dulcis]|uniref:CCHC-type domain-containing protein n=1 Tax=Prunus dulcis TaxID=3755 RepID=A0A4Y1RYZ1_PRUDU|nr:hypothetical protein Prudu_021531 [Prunus dulcis]